MIVAKLDCAELGVSMCFLLGLFFPGATKDGSLLSPITASTDGARAPRTPADDAELLAIILASRAATIT